MNRNSKNHLPFDSLSGVILKNNVFNINATDMSYRQLNSILKNLEQRNVKTVKIYNVYGQRYIGTNLKGKMKIDIFGTPGNDLAAFMDGSCINVYGNAQDCIANTMNDGQIIIHGNAGEIAGYGMRGGKVFVRNNVGYRAGIHMKEYLTKKPCIIIGGTAQDFLGEYMAGGVLTVLGLNLNDSDVHNTRFVGSGMHGGVIYVRGKFSDIGKEVKIMDVTQTDLLMITSMVQEYCKNFNADFASIMNKEFHKIVPHSNRPYKKLYAY